MNIPIENISELVETKLDKGKPLKLNISQQLIPDDILNDKSKKWKQYNTKRYSVKRKFGFVEGQKDKLPCEVLRY